MEIDTNSVNERLIRTLEFQGSPEDATIIAQCAADAAALVGDYIGTISVPEGAALLAATEVARDLHTRLSAPGGVLSPFADSAPVRLARDPLKAAYPIIAPYMPGGFA